MRMRRKRHLDERLAAVERLNLGLLQDYINEVRSENPNQILDFNAIFGNNNPVHLDIGCGMGRFINTIATEKPNINFIGIESNRNVLVSAMEDTCRENIPNVRYIVGYAQHMEKMIPKNSIECIYLNFSCPYPKSTYIRHRLTNPLFLDIYGHVLAENGTISQKTDNRQLFEYSLVNFSKCNFTINDISLDLHKSDIKGNIITEYENRFIEQGLPIYYVNVSKNIYKNTLLLQKNSI